jgi:hypothetical protein
MQMNVNGVLDTVPRSFKNAAWVVALAFAVGGIAIAWANVVQPRHFSTAFTIAEGVAFGLLAGAFASIWVLSLGYVYADARRRTMPPLLWTLVAAFIPNLLGFLVYFACRKPLALPCPHCGQANVPGQRFCSWCGHVASGPLASEGNLA